MEGISKGVLGRICSSNFPGICTFLSISATWWINRAFSSQRVWAANREGAELLLLSGPLHCHHLVLLDTREVSEVLSKPHQVILLKILSAQQWVSDNSLPEIRAELQKDLRIASVCVLGGGGIVLCMCTCACACPCIFRWRWWVRIRPKGDHVTTEIATIA